MKLISTKSLRDAQWEQIYSYDGIKLSFRIFASEAIPGLTITHERSNNKLKTKSVYTVQTARGPQRTISPSYAVKVYNEEVKRIAAVAGRPITDSPESARSARGTTGL